MSSVAPFYSALSNTLFKWCYSYQDKYWDERRFGPPPQKSILEKLKHQAKVIAGKRGWTSRNFAIPLAGDAAAAILSDGENYARGYERLADEYSRQLYLDLLAMRVLGPRHVRTPVNTAAYWRDYQENAARITKRNTGEGGVGAIRWPLHQYDIKGQQGVMHIHMGPGTYYYYFVLRSYDYQHSGVSIGVEKDDFIINGGGCYGDTDIMFADRCAPTGRVFTFEFVPDNLVIMKQNMDSNPHLSRRIEVVQNALAELSGDMLYFKPFGPGTQVSKQNSGGLSVSTLTIDDLVKSRKLDRVDFIKLDIEGSELAALKGAAKTLKQFKPKLAISAYHKPEDFYELSDYIDSLGLGYRFYMDHFTVHLEETVLFATCR
jgi:FkbM family methyltransferase